MTKEQGCTSCGAPTTLVKTLPLCSRCGLAISEEALAFVFDGLRSGAGTIELPTATQSRMSPAEADDVSHRRLATLRRKGVERVTFHDFRELMEITGRSRPWVYMWLDERVKDGSLTKDTTTEPVSYTFAY